MAVFNIDGKEFELRLTYKAVKHLNGLFEGGAYEIVGKAVSADLVASANDIHAALTRTGKYVAIKEVEHAIESAIDGAVLAFDDISKIPDQVVTQSFFLKATVTKMMERNPEMAKALKQ